jgi:hypothetical protein
MTVGINPLRAIGGPRGRMAGAVLGIYGNSKEEARLALDAPELLQGHR